MHSFNNKPNKSFSKQRSFSRPDNRPRIQVSSEGSNSSEHKEGNRERKPFNRDGNRPHFGNRSSFGGKKPFNREGGNRPHFGNRDRNEHRSFNRDGNRPHFGNRDDRGERKPFNRDNTNQSLENNDNKPVGERKPFNREQRPHFAGNRDRGERRLFNNRDGGNRPHFGNRDGGERRTFNRDGGNRPRFGGNRDRGERRINVQHEIDPNKDLTKLTDIIFNIIKNENNRPLPFRVLVSILIKQHKEELGYINENEAKKVVDDLVSEKKIFLIRGDNYVLENKGNENTHHFTDINDFKISGKGFISLNASGNGFISLNDKEKALYFVNKADTHSAQNGDFVEFKAKEPNTNDDHHLTNAVVVCILEHAKEMYVGEVVIGCDKKYIKLDDVKANLNIIVDSYDGLVNGTKVLLKITKYENNNAYASVLRIIGHKSDVGVDIESIVYDNGIPIDFSIAASEYAKKIAINIDEKQRSIRTDLTDKPIVTIDPTTSKDFDDAFYCEERADGNFLLAVQIADPVHYVQYQSPLDKDAVERGCSVYLVDRVIPMVPHNLSDDICSLNPNQERLTLSCDMIVNKEGEIIDIKVFPSIIKSKRRFTYDEVNEYIEKKTDFSKEDIEVKRSIDIGLKISDLLYKNKVIRGYINFEIPKAVIKVDEKGEPIEIVKEQHKLAQRLIEDFAVAANESVTNYAIKKNYPFIFRIHDKPEEKRIKIFSIEAKKMDFKITTDLKNIQPNDVSK
jgi:ribonuclease R